MYNVKRRIGLAHTLESSSGMSVERGTLRCLAAQVGSKNERISPCQYRSDGRVLQWNIKKGISVSCLIRLGHNGKNDAWISRQAAGLCFDFCQDDPSAHRRTGRTIHKCSVSYSEQYLNIHSTSWACI